VIASTDAPAPSTRQLLSKRQAATVDALLDAALEVIRESGYESLTIRNVASRAGVTHTTAYTYFASKEHLVAELNWRIVRSVPPPVVDDAEPLAMRLTNALRDTSAMYADEPALAKAILATMLSPDPEVQRIRTAIGNDIARRIQMAVGADADPRILDGALLVHTGAMLQAGLDYSTFGEVAARIGAIAELWDGNA
jgi:AcrR family transcriptional regulator